VTIRIAAYGSEATAEDAKISRRSAERYAVSI